MKTAIVQNKLYAKSYQARIVGEKNGNYVIKTCRMSVKEHSSLYLGCLSYILGK